MEQPPSLAASSFSSPHHATLLLPRMTPPTPPPARAPTFAPADASSDGSGGSGSGSSSSDTSPISVIPIVSNEQILAALKDDDLGELGQLLGTDGTDSAPPPPLLPPAPPPHRSSSPPSLSSASDPSSFDAGLRGAAAQCYSCASSSSTNTSPASSSSSTSSSPATSPLSPLGPAAATTTVTSTAYSQHVSMPGMPALSSSAASAVSGTDSLSSSSSQYAPAPRKHMRTASLGLLSSSTATTSSTPAYSRMSTPPPSGSLAASSTSTLSSFKPIVPSSATPLAPAPATPVATSRLNTALTPQPLPSLTATAPSTPLYAAASANRAPLPLPRTTPVLPTATTTTAAAAASSTSPPVAANTRKIVLSASSIGPRNGTRYSITPASSTAGAGAPSTSVSLRHSNSAVPTAHHNGAPVKSSPGVPILPRTLIPMHTVTAAAATAASSAVISTSSDLTSAVSSPVAAIAIPAPTTTLTSASASTTSAAAAAAASTTAPATPSAAPTMATAAWQQQQQQAYLSAVAAQVSRQFATPALYPVPVVGGIANVSNLPGNILWLLLDPTNQQLVAAVAPVPPGMPFETSMIRPFMLPPAADTAVFASATANQPLKPYGLVPGTMIGMYVAPLSMLVCQLPTQGSSSNTATTTATAAATSASKLALTSTASASTPATYHHQQQPLKMHQQPSSALTSALSASHPSSQPTTSSSVTTAISSQQQQQQQQHQHYQQHKSLPSTPASTIPQPAPTAPTIAPTTTTSPPTHHQHQQPAPSLSPQQQHQQQQHSPGNPHRSPLVSPNGSPGAGTLTTTESLPPHVLARAPVASPALQYAPAAASPVADSPVVSAHHYSPPSMQHQPQHHALFTSPTETLAVSKREPAPIALFSPPSAMPASPMAFFAGTTASAAPEHHHGANANANTASAMPATPNMPTYPCFTKDGVFVVRKGDEWNSRERAIFLKCFVKNGTQFASIANAMGSKSATQIKRYYTLRGGARGELKPLLNEHYHLKKRGALGEYDTALTPTEEQLLASGFLSIPIYLSHNNSTYQLPTSSVTLAAVTSRDQMPLNLSSSIVPSGLGSPAPMYVTSNATPSYDLFSNAAGYDSLGYLFEETEEASGSQGTVPYFQQQLQHTAPAPTPAPAPAPAPAATALSPDATASSAIAIPGVSASTTSTSDSLSHSPMTISPGGRSGLPEVAGHLLDGDTGSADETPPLSSQKRKRSKTMAQMFPPAPSSVESGEAAVAVVVGSPSDALRKRQKIRLTPSPRIASSTGENTSSPSKRSRRALALEIPGNCAEASINQTDIFTHVCSPKLHNDFDGGTLEYYKELWDEARFKGGDDDVVRHVSAQLRYYYPPRQRLSGHPHYNRNRSRNFTHRRAASYSASSLPSAQLSPPLTSLQQSGDIMALCLENVVALYDTSNRGEGKAFADLRGHAASICAVSFSPSPPYLLATRDDSGIVQVWPPISLQSSTNNMVAPIAPMVTIRSSVESTSARLVWSKQNRMLAIHDEDCVFLYDIATSNTAAAPLSPISFRVQGGITSISIQEHTTEQSDGSASLGTLLVSTVWPAEVRLYNVRPGTTSPMASVAVNENRCLAAVTFHPSIPSLIIGLDLRGPRPALHLFKFHVAYTPDASLPACQLEMAEILQFQMAQSNHTAPTGSTSVTRSVRWELEPALFLARDDTPMFRADEHFSSWLGFDANGRVLLVYARGTLVKDEAYTPHDMSPGSFLFLDETPVARVFLVDFASVVDQWRLDSIGCSLSLSGSSDSLSGSSSSLGSSMASRPLTLTTEESLANDEPEPPRHSREPAPPHVARPARLLVPPLFGRSQSLSQLPQSSAWTNAAQGQQQPQQPQQQQLPQRAPAQQPQPPLQQHNAAVVVPALDCTLPSEPPSQPTSYNELLLDVDGLFPFDSETDFSEHQFLRSTHQDDDEADSAGLISQYESLMSTSSHAGFL